MVAVMTTTLVRQHHRRKPERSRNDPFKEMIDARKAILAARIKPREQWDRDSLAPLFVKRKSLKTWAEIKRDYRLAACLGWWI